MALKSLKKVRITQMLGQDILIILLDKQVREIRDQDKILDRIEELYTELYDSVQNTIIHTDPKDIRDNIMGAVLRDMKNGTAPGNDHINIETLIAEEDTISKTLANPYTKCLSERRIPRACKNAKMMKIFRKGNKKDVKNYRPLCLLSNIYKYSRKY